MDCAFNDKYTPIKVLGEGGYGTVWLVQRDADKTLCAAKVISDEGCRKTWCDDRREHIPEEITLSETLDHPNLVDLYELFLEEDMWIVVMEYLPGYEDLFDYVSANGPLAVEDAREVITQILDTVLFLISSGVDHRDIKSENILFNPTTRRVRLIDFGCASPLPAAPYDNPRGTAIFLPPEVYDRGSYSALPATTWSIGCLAFTLLNGYLPFATRADVEDRRLEEFSQTLDEESKKFVLDLLVVNEDQRMTPKDITRHQWIDWMSMD
jgi:serine/threonine protein kinase